MVVGKADLAFDPNAARLGLHALKLNAVIEFVYFDAVEQAVEIEVPPGAAVLAVRRHLKANPFLFPDQLLDLLVLDFLEIGRADRALLALGARLLERLRTQEAADQIGAEGGNGSFHCHSPNNWRQILALDARARKSTLREKRSPRQLKKTPRAGERSCVGAIPPWLAFRRRARMPYCGRGAARCASDVSAAAL